MEEAAETITKGKAGKASAKPTGKKRYGPSPINKGGDHGKSIRILETVYHVNRDIIALTPEGSGATPFQ